MVRLELATPRFQTQCSRHSAIQLKRYCWEGVEVIQLVYCLIIYLSFLNYVSLIYSRSTVVLLDKGTTCTSREIYNEDPMVRLKHAKPGLQTEWSSH